MLAEPGYMVILAMAGAVGFDSEKLQVYMHPKTLLTHINKRTLSEFFLT